MFNRCCFAFVACFFAVGTLQAEDFAERILDYFPGAWEHKSEDGTLSGTVTWRKVAGGKAVAGRGKLDGAASFSMAGWDPAEKVWFHVWYAKDGEHGRLTVTRFEKDTYHGTVYRVDPDGTVTKSPWQNKIIDNDHFVVTYGEGDQKEVIHWHRVTK